MATTEDAVLTGPAALAAASLAQLLDTGAGPEPERDDDVIYHSLVEARRRLHAPVGASYAVIPKLVPRRGSRAAAAPTATAVSPTSADASLARSVRVWARGTVARRRALEAITPRDIVQACVLLVQHASRAGSEAAINYDAFCTVRDSLGPRFFPYFTATTFATFPRDAGDSIRVRSFVRYLAYKVQVHSMWRRVAAYDSEGDGCLREPELEAHVFESIPELPDLAGLQENFYAFYCFTAVRKMFFYLDPARTGRIAVRDLLSSRVFAEWLQLWSSWHRDIMHTMEEVIAQSEAHAPPGSGGSSEALRAAAVIVNAALGAGSGDVPPSNWFSAANAVHVYSNYLNLDANQNGLLSPQELAAMNGGSFTDAFITRLFQEVHTYDGQMDYKAYLDFVLATEYRSSPHSMKYMFRILDARKCGYLTLLDVRSYFREVVAKLMASGHDAIDTANVCDEIFDMVHPSDPTRLTFEDLRRCRQGHTVLQMLTDAAGFWAYDNREVLLQQQMQSADPSSQPSTPTAAADAHAHAFEP